MSVLAVIPARSGSKGLKDKNIKKLNGKPLLVYTIEAALHSCIFDQVHVSTDSEEYANISRKHGADVPFLRDLSLSSDESTTWDAMKYVLDEYKKRGMDFDILTVLQPTSPLRDAQDIQHAWKFFQEKNADMISSVCEMNHSPLWSNTLPEDLSLKNFEDERIVYIPRQNLPIYYRENGAIYIVKSQILLTKNNIYKENSYAFIMDRMHSVDIDDEIDFELAELLIRKRYEREASNAINERKIYHQ